MHLKLPGADCGTRNWNGQAEKDPCVHSLGELFQPTVVLLQPPQGGLSLRVSRDGHLLLPRGGSREAVGVFLVAGSHHCCAPDAVLAFLQLAVRGILKAKPTRVALCSHGLVSVL